MALDTNEQITKLAELMPTFLASYAKRFLEKAYDGAFQSPLGKKLLALSAKKKYGIEFILYALTAFFETRLAENTKLAKFVKEVSMDAAPEISKRLVNSVRAEVSSSAKTPEEREVADLLLGFEDKELTELIRWLYDKDLQEKISVLAGFSSLSPEQVARLMNFSAEDRDRFFGIIDPRTRPKEGRGLLGVMADDINKLNDRLEGKEAKQ